MTHKNLTTQAPRSANEMIEGFAIIARTIDKCRAVIAGENGEYHFNCPLDKMLFEFKGTDANAFKAKTKEGASDVELALFVKETGTSKTDDEISAWSEEVKNTMYHDDPEKKEWFDGECKRLGLDPATTSLFQMLDADDMDMFK